jgi:two-component system response regulator YesN
MERIQGRRLTNASVFVFMLLFLLVFSSIFAIYMVFNNQLTQQLVDTNIELLRQQNNKLELTMKGIDQTTIQLLKSPDVGKFYDYELNEWETSSNLLKISGDIANAINSNPFVFSIDMYSYSKQRFLTGNMMSNQDFKEDYEWVKNFEQFEGYFRWMATRKVRLNQSSYPIYRNVVTLVRTYPLLHAPGSRKGAVAVNIKEDYLFSLLHNTEAADVGQTVVIDRDGVVVLHADKSKLGKDISEFPYISRILNDSGNDGYFSAEVDRTMSSVFYVQSTYPEWIMLRIVPKAQFIQPLLLIRNGLIVLAVVLFVVASLSVAVVGRWTFKPLNRIISSMTGSIQNQSPGSSNVKYKDEFHYFESTVQMILQDQEYLSKQVNDSKPLIKWQLLSDLLSNNRKRFSAPQSILNMLGVPVFASRHIVMSLEFDNKQDIPTSRDMQLYSYALCNIAEELMNEESHGTAAELRDGRCVVIMSFDDEEEAERHMIRAVAVADLLKNFISEYFKRTITIGIGDPVDDIDAIHKSYKQSLEALKYKLVMGGNSILTQEDITSDPSPQFYKLFAMTDSMVDSVKLLDADKVKLQVHRWFEAFADHNVQPEMIIQLIVQCLMKAATVAAEIGVDAEDIIPKQQMDELLDQYEQLEQLEQFTVQSMINLISRIKEKRSGREHNPVIDQVMTYIGQNYMRSDLSLNLLSSEFKISVSYLSKLFKEQEEINFIDYLMEIRMNKAKDLLAQTDEKVRDIAEFIGYANVNSFVRIFKKVTGLTPTEYRERTQAKK